MCKYVFLQLSDLHFGKENQTSQEMRDRLRIDVIKQAVKQQFHYDGLIISGDIVFGKAKNKKKAYKAATTYIKDIQNKLRIPKSHIYMVPGNHDIDLQNDNRTNAVLNARKTYQPRNGVILTEDKKYLGPTDPFMEMYRSVTGKNYTIGHSVFRSYDDIDFLCIDSSYLCTTSTEDYGKIILGINDVTHALSGHRRDKRLVVIAHHRYDWLLEGEKNKLLSTLSKNNALLFCCGHVHSAEAYSENSLYTNGSNITVSVSPTLMDDNSEETVMGYNIIHFDSDDGSVLIESFEWKDNGMRFSLNWQYPKDEWNKEKNDDPLVGRMGLRVNSCELCLHRTARKLSMDDLAEATGIERSTIEKYEKLNRRFTLDNMLIYPECKRSIDIVKLSYALRIKPSDLVSYPDYWKNKSERLAKYEKIKGVKPKDMPGKRKKTRVIVFDFDGTITKNATLKTSWERMWISCGYSVEECRELHKAFSLGQFGHQEWCEKTAEAFKQRGFSCRNIAEIASDIKPLDDYEEVITHLRTRGMQLFIVSGSIDALIKEVLGERIVSMFTKIQSNQMHFDQDGKLERIIGTKYDFDGKAKYIEEIIADGYSPNEIVFFGNSFNDESVCRTGVRSICINPKQTRVYDPKCWTDEKTNVTSMKDFLQYIDE